MEELGLDFIADNARAGFRLNRVELYNWGTFNRRVWTMTPAGENGLLTGEIGSGKSTLVDAVTTLLVPAQRITYNKAAGAESRERTLKSYVLGYYKSERGEAGLSARPVALRDHNSYSVILGYFYNAGFDRHVTLAQVFYIRDPQGQPDRFYVVADVPLGIAAHFADFGSDFKVLRKRLRETERVQLFNNFPPYGAAFRSRLGIGNEQALELFNQTVSMKSVGNLTEFVRTHMLQPAPIEDNIRQLIRHFDDLNRAHEAVLKARDQVEQLKPIVADADQYAERCAVAERYRGCRDALEPWFAQLKAELLETRIAEFERRLARLDEQIDTLRRSRREQEDKRDEIRQAIAENGGDRLQRIRSEIERLEEQKRQCQTQAERYRELVKALDLPDAADADTFHANRQRLETVQADLESHRAGTQNRLTDLEVEMRGFKREHEALESELASLKSRRSNLPAAMIEIRRRLCETLDLPPGALPFAGELIRVRDGERDWEGAIERILHGFALSLLVPDEHYAAVARWVDDTHLRGRLVYYRVPEQVGGRPQPVGPDSLVRKVEVKKDSPVRDWLEAELTRRFDYVCCTDLKRFRREKYAITRSGQIRGGSRHEKDDRHRIDDRTRYVLGWSNEDKIRALTEQRRNLEGRMQAIADDIAVEVKALRQADQRWASLSQLKLFDSYRALDWRTPAKAIDGLDKEYAALQAQSDVLKTLQEQLGEVGAQLERLDADSQQTGDDRGAARNGLETATADRDECLELVKALPEEARRESFAWLEEHRPEALGEAPVNLRGIDIRQREFREWLKARIDTEDKQIGRLNDRIISGMNDFRHRWPQETRDFDASVAAAGEYRTLLEQLTGDDLPRFEARFKELLNENTIREVATFQARLHRECGNIEARIDTINRSLREIEYESGRYIKLLAETTPDTEVRDFRQRLRACTEGTTTGSEDDQYSEQKFLQVKQIIERFRGRDGTAEIDRRWTSKVTDVRNWFVFSASERWLEDDQEYEHYTDSGGKSGGQKEKLAYTVLAASLAYQFGLEQGERRSKSFRFVVIDEAFGRGSDESAHYGLKLFQRLNLQLLIVTPLQKIHVIEPYVSGVGFVSNPDGRESLLRHLTIEEYRAEKAARARVGVEPRRVETLDDAT